MHIAAQHINRYYSDQQFSTLLLWWIRAQPNWAALLFCAARAGFDSPDRMRAFFAKLAVHENLLGEG
jgi:hypothetical protein